MSAKTVVHIVGAGMSGLAAAVASAERGIRVHLYEASSQAGGRSRSFHDARLDRTIDNGNHLLLSGNSAVMNYLGTVGATGGLTGPARAAFPFVDIRSGERWCVRPSRGPLPWWILRKDRRIPGTSARDYAKVLRIACARSSETVHACVGNTGMLYERFLEPLGVGALNTPAHEGAANLLWPVLRETFAKGEKFCRPRMARLGLTETLVQPALAWLRRQGTSIHFSHRLRAIRVERNQACALGFGHVSVPLERHHRLILAVPPQVASGLLPSLTVPTGHCAIVNAHYVLARPAPQPFGHSFVGVIGGTAQWIFLRGDVASVTTSAAASLARRGNEELACEIWQDVAKALYMAPAPKPLCRIIKEKQATFRQSPDNLRRRPKTNTDIPNVFLAGDWTDTGLPATIEGAVRSGFAAARAARRAH